MSNQDVSMMLSQLILKTQEVFLGGNDWIGKRKLTDILVYLPNYIESITNVLKSVSETIPSTSQLILKEILLFLNFSLNE